MYTNDSRCHNVTDLGKFANLPKEYVLWTVERSEEARQDDSDAENESSEDERLFCIQDQYGAMISANTRALSSPADNQLFLLLVDCLTHPLSGKPRRPSHLCIPWQYSRDLGTALAVIGITVSQSRVQLSTRTDYEDKVPLRKCNTCSRRGDQELFQTCSKCGAVFYCSAKCEEQDRKKTGEHAHSVWCSSIKLYMQNEEPLAELPFTFTHKSTDRDFTEVRLKELLDENCLSEDELWKMKLYCCRKNVKEYGDLAVGCSELGHPADVPERQMQDWAEYYRWRHLSLDSPIATQLTFALTAYHILVSHFLLENEEMHLNLHIIGCEKEVDSLFYFKEIQYLLPQHKFHIFLIGPNISKKVSREFNLSDRMIVSVHRGLYHKLQLPRPHLAIGFNAGLAAYKAWVETLHTLKLQQTPAFFTDYCRYSCEASRQCVTALSIGHTTEPSINPFRCPLRKSCEEHIMPWYSNAFIYRLYYHPEHLTSTV